MIARCVTLLLALALSLAFPGVATAHDFGSLKVAATFTDSAYSIDITLFPEHFPADRRPHFPLSAEFLARFAEGASITFDGTTARSEIVPLNTATSPDDQVVPVPTIRLTGTIPPGASMFRWSHTFPTDDYLFTTKHARDLETTPQWLRGAALSEPFALNQSAPPRHVADTIVEYLKLGFTHIVPEGLDHILFVLSLFLLSLKPRAILTQVTAFTIAHSLTLALSMYGVVRLPSSIVEPLIALSIAFVAIENIFVRKARPARTVVVFLFGLLHGMGFAGVLTDIGLPRTQFVPALISFNVGVELGQLTVIAAAYLAIGAWFGAKPWYRSRITVPASAAIACIAVYWTIERVITG